MTDTTETTSWECHGLKKGTECKNINPSDKENCYRCGSDKSKFGKYYEADRDAVLTWDCCVCRWGNEAKEKECDYCPHLRCETCHKRGPPEEEDQPLWLCVNEKRAGVECATVNIDSATECRRCGKAKKGYTFTSKHRTDSCYGTKTWYCCMCKYDNIEDDKECDACPHEKCNNGCRPVRHGGDGREDLYDDDIVPGSRTVTYV